MLIYQEKKIQSLSGATNTKDFEKLQEKEKEKNEYDIADQRYTKRSFSYT